MTDKQALREKFEAWAEEAGALPWGHIKKQRTASGNYSVQIYTYMWQAWNACHEALLDELEALQSFRTAYMEWSDKTDWVQTDKRIDVIKPWGKHRADVLKLYIDHLKSNLEAAEHTAAVDHEAACSLVEENEELKRKLEAAEQRIAEQREYYEGVIADGSKRIAELEARTVKLPYLPADCDRTEAHFKYQEAIRAAGIQVIEGEQKNG